MVHVMKPFQNK